MKRRDFILGTGAAALMLKQKSALASGSGHAGHKKPNSAYKKAIEASYHCLQTGEACIAHCIDLLGTGDKSMKDCIASAKDMMALCGAMTKVAGLGKNKKLIQQTANVCANACEACANECKKHSDKHAACKACLESCLACMKACKTIA